MSSSTQPVQLTDALKYMLELQDIDNRLKSWEKQRLALSKTVETSQAEVKACQARQDELKKSTDVEKKKRGLLELEVKTKEEEARKHNAQLGELRDNDAYKAKLSEIQSCRKAITDLEEQVLHLIENEEAIRAKFDEEAKNLDVQTREAESKQAQMLADAKVFEDKMGSEQGKRKALLDQMGKYFADIYLRFLEGHKGKVIAQVENELCGSCRMKVSAHQINEVKKLKNLCYCQNCGVILAVAA